MSEASDILKEIGEMITRLSSGASDIRVGVRDIQHPVGQGYNPLVVDKDGVLELSVPADMFYTQNEVLRLLATVLSACIPNQDAAVSGSHIDEQLVTEDGQWVFAENDRPVTV